MQRPFLITKMYSYNVEMIRRFKLKVIIAHDLKGEYGHGAHMINSNALTEALEISNNSSLYPDSAENMGYGMFQNISSSLWRKQSKMNWDIPLDKFDGKTAMKWQCMAFHFTNHNSNGIQ